MGASRSSVAEARWRSLIEAQAGGDKRKGEAEARKLHAEAALAELDLLLREEASVRQAERIKAHAEAFVAVEKAKQEAIKTEQARLEMVKGYQDLMERAPVLLREHLLQRMTGALEVRTGDESVSVVTSGTYAFLTEGDKVRKVALPAFVWVAAEVPQRSTGRA